VSGAGERLRRFDRTISLRDGTLAHMRPIRTDDAPRLVALYDHLSRDTRYHRFFSVMRRLPPDWARFLADVDYEQRLALVIESPEDPDTLITVARYEPAGEPGRPRSPSSCRTPGRIAGSARCCSPNCWPRRD